MDVPLIGLAHGSRDPAAAVAIGELMREVAKRRPPLVAVPAFLDLSEPDLTVAVAGLGVPRAVVVPLLFTEAFHAGVDVPKAARAATRSTGVELVPASILGLGEAVLTALQGAAEAAGIGAGATVMLLAVGSSNKAANAAVAAVGERWARRRAAPVMVGHATGKPAAATVLAQAIGTNPEVGVVPLFLAPGLLLGPTARAARAAGVPMAAPLGIGLADRVLACYDAALALVPSS